MTRPLRVAHVVTKLAVGGAQATVLATCAGLDRERFEPVILTGREEDEEGTLFADAESLGLEVHLVPELVRAIRPVLDRRAVAAVADRLASSGAELVHTHSSKAGVVGRLAAVRLGLPVVHSVHGWSFHEEMAPPLRAALVQAERWLARRTDALVVVAEPDRAKGLAAGIGSAPLYHLIRSGIPLSGLERNAAAGEQFRSTLGIGSDSIVVGTVGRLADQKDPATMVAALALLVADLDAHLVWVGDGPLRGELTVEIQRRGLHDRIHLPGVRRDIEAVLSGFDVFALSSRWEGLPRTLTEAMALRVPVVATAVDGCAELITDGMHGLLVPPADPAALAQAVGRLIDDPTLAACCIAAAAERVRDWDLPVMLEATQDLYDRVVLTATGSSRHHPRPRSS